jgi:hypothetical protein
MVIYVTQMQVTRNNADVLTVYKRLISAELLDVLRGFVVFRFS